MKRDNIIALTGLVMALGALVFIQTMLYWKGTELDQRMHAFKGKNRELMWGIHEALEEQDIALSQEINKLIHLQTRGKALPSESVEWVKKEMERVIDSVSRYYDFDVSVYFRIAKTCHDCEGDGKILLQNYSFHEEDLTIQNYHVRMGYRVDDQDYHVFFFYPQREDYVSGGASRWILASFIPIVMLMLLTSYFLKKSLPTIAGPGLQGASPHKEPGSPPEEKPEAYMLGDYLFDYSTQTLYYENQSISLSKREADILHILCENKNQVLKREEALKKIWGSIDYFNRRSMDVYISKLRKHLSQDARVKITNVHGKGFILTDEA